MIKLGHTGRIEPKIIRLLCVGVQCGGVNGMFGNIPLISVSPSRCLALRDPVCSVYGGSRKVVMRLRLSGGSGNGKGDFSLIQATFVLRNWITAYTEVSEPASSS
jgi:hypothetical protein